jgi:hypothetical protein
VVVVQVLVEVELLSLLLLLLLSLLHVLVAVLYVWLCCHPGQSSCSERLCCKPIHLLAFGQLIQMS